MKKQPDTDPRTAEPDDGLPRRRFMYSPLFFGGGILVAAVTLADFILRRTAGKEWELGLIPAGIGIGYLPLLRYRRRTAAGHDDCRRMRAWIYALGIALYAGSQVFAADGVRFPLLGFLCLGGSIAAGITGETFRRSGPSRSNLGGTPVGFFLISLAGAWLSGWIFRASASGEELAQLLPTPAAAAVLGFGSGILLRHNERCDRV